MLRLTLTCLFGLIYLKNVCLAANILAVISVPSYSHQIPFRPLWRALSARGHNITLITSDPLKDPALKNFQEIDISYGYKVLEDYKCVETAANDSISLIETARAVRLAATEVMEKFLQSPEGQNLLNNKDNRFDLLIVEALLVDMMSFSWKYQIPFIGVASLDCSIQFHDVVGNPTHPLINPDPNFYIEDINNMSFYERLMCFLSAIVYKYYIYVVSYKRDHDMLSKYFGNDLPSMVEIQNNMSMLFVATNPIFHNVRALMPNTITIGNGMHISPPKALPKEIEEFLNDTKGVVYFSLGSNIKGKLLNDSVKSELVNGFKRIPYRVLWKLDHTVPNIPDNVKIVKWLPQQDILRHPNVKVFITQGGLQSMQESIYFNKPMIGIPFFGDQHMNVKRMITLGYGVKISKHNITKESVSEAILEVMSNPIYRQKAEEFGDIFRDTDIPNVDKAVWWTEYVIRHKGAKHFRNPALDMPLWEYWMLDVLAVVLCVLSIVTYLLWKLFKLLFTRLLGGNKKSTNPKKKYQ
ncbi:hypothetical protein GWI33_020644 [Rhynchophorus ferrugineus]|uniref:UDP-glucuronosyltransferase n=1 Tax=Rhynchophorus ferrugineus TaxID=354439 RepID=A0A834HQE6_RHYFE|nr:hypothetical protein GWI33_020644 [Rhynchophorus ferrugineus]